MTKPRRTTNQDLITQAEIEDWRTKARTEEASGKRDGALEGDF